MWMLDFHHPTTKKRMKENKLLLKCQSILLIRYMVEFEPPYLHEKAHAEELRSVYKMMKFSSIPLKVCYLNVVFLIKLNRY